MAPTAPRTQKKHLPNGLKSMCLLQGPCEVPSIPPKKIQKKNIFCIGLNPEGFHGPSHILTKTLPINICYKKDIVRSVISEQPALQIPASTKPIHIHSPDLKKIHCGLMDFAGGISATKWIHPKTHNRNTMNLKKHAGWDQPCWLLPPTTPLLLTKTIFQHLFVTERSFCNKQFKPSGPQNGC